MKRDPVQIEQDLRSVVLVAILDKLRSDRIEPLVASLDNRHLHVLARFVDDKPKDWTGRTKQHASPILREQNLRSGEGGIWAKGCHVTPIADRQHQIRVFGYIRDHRRAGAAVWTIPLPPAKPADGHPEGISP